MAFTPFASTAAAVRLNGVTLTAKQWTVEESVDELDTSNFEGGGYSDRIAGLKTARVTIEIDLDGQANPWDLNAYSGSTLTNVFLYLNTTAGPKWQFPSFLVLAGTNPSDVKSNGKLTIRGANKGTYTKPTGVIAS
jgi:hypothetical protein